MTRKTHDLCVKTGSYTDREGNEKGRWMNVGALMEGDNGPFIMLNACFNPAGLREEGRESILISCFEPQQDNQREHEPQRPAPRHGDRAGGAYNRR
jgi:hypothetical protein